MERMMTSNQTNVDEIREIYRDYRQFLYDLNYSVSSKCTASELIIFCNGIIPPTDEQLKIKKINVNLRSIIE